MAKSMFRGKTKIPKEQLSAMKTKWQKIKGLLSEKNGKKSVVRGQKKIEKS